MGGIEVSLQSMRETEGQAEHHMYSRKGVMTSGSMSDIIGVARHYVLYEVVVNNRSERMVAFVFRWRALRGLRSMCDTDFLLLAMVPMLAFLIARSDDVRWLM